MARLLRVSETAAAFSDLAAPAASSALQDGPVLLVGHSYGGVVITEDGNDPKVAGLVYIAAFAPDKGESVSTLIKDPPPGAPVPPILAPQDGYLFLDKAKFPASFAGDVDHGREGGGKRTDAGSHRGCRFSLQPKTISCAIGRNHKRDRRGYGGRRGKGRWKRRILIRRPPKAPDVRNLLGDHFIVNGKIARARFSLLENVHNAASDPQYGI